MRKLENTPGLLDIARDWVTKWVRVVGLQTAVTGYREYGGLQLSSEWREVVVRIEASVLGSDA